MTPKSHEGIWRTVDNICERIMHVISIILIVPCAVVLVAWVFVFATFIIGRAVFNVNWQFVEEFTAYWLVLLAFFSFPYTLWKGGHINIDILVKRFSARTRNILAVVTSFLALIIVCYLTLRGIEWFWYGFVQEVHAMTPIGTLLWPIYFLIPFGFSVLSLMLLLQLYRFSMPLILGKKAETNEE